MSSAALHDPAQDRDASWELESTSAILELMVQLAAAHDVRTGCRVLAEQLPASVGATRGAIGLVGSATGRCRLEVLSGLQDFDARTELPQAVEAVLQQAASSEAPLVFPDGEHSGALTKLAGVASCSRVFAGAFKTAEGVSIGAWVLWGDASANEPANVRFLAAASEPLAASLSSLQRTGRGKWRSQVKIPASLRPRRWLKPTLVLMGLVAAASLAIPFDYKIACECQLQPATRRFVAAPFAGVLEKSLVAPGDLVARDQILGILDGKEIRWELASLTAEEQRVSKAHDVNLAAGKVAAAQIDRLEMERLDQKRRLLEHRAEHLEVRSPVEGILLSGDLKRSEGIPLAIGQRLYEVAPLERMIVEILIPDEEVSFAAPSQRVLVDLDAFGSRRWEGRLERIEPRSEVRDNQNVFLGEFTVANDAATLRPGMKGHARIVSPPQRLGWILFHSAWNRLRRWAGC